MIADVDTSFLVKDTAQQKQCEAVWFADYVCSGVPHYEPDASRTFVDVASSATELYSDDLLKTLVFADILTNHRALIDSAPDQVSSSVASLRQYVISSLAPYIRNRPQQWGSRFQQATLEVTDFSDHQGWNNWGSGAVMGISPFALSEATDMEVTIVTASTHLHPESISAAVALVHAIRVARNAANPDEALAAAHVGAIQGLAASEQLHDMLHIESPKSRSAVDAIEMTQEHRDLDSLAKEPSDYISARYVLAAGLAAFAGSTSDGVKGVIEHSSQFGDPDTTAVVAMSLQQAFRAEQVANEIHTLQNEYKLATFDDALREIAAIGRS